MPGLRKSLDQWNQMIAELANPEWLWKSAEHHRFLRDMIYAGLQDLNTGFDSPLIGHFSPADFLIVIDRCECLDVCVIGIEVFSIDVEPRGKWHFLRSKSLQKTDTSGRGD